MQLRKECIAMLLAGGQGSRLGVLTRDMAKPAVPFGGKYRIIDFTLSNCINSGIDTVGVLTQYQPLILNNYIGNGQPWDLDRLHGGVNILPPFIRGKAGEWYRGTANAILQNSNFIESYNPDYVLVLSGDHIYKMDYSKMLEFHKRKSADCTIAVIEVPLAEASRFGIMNMRTDDRIFEFEEKPKVPKSSMASMGVYIFSWKKLREYLEADDKDSASANDFGKNVIPAMLKAGERMFAYRFRGYWKDVGTVESLWEANMDLLEPNLLNLGDASWRIYSRNPIKPPHYVAPGAHVTRSLLTEGSSVYGYVEDSIIFHGAQVGANARVYGSIVLPDAIIGEGAVVEYAVIGEGATVGPGARVGGDQDKGISVVGSGLRVGAKAVVPPGVILDADAAPAVELDGGEATA
jgi:glucose-1-phosphate adenylyltransferase